MANPTVKYTIKAKDETSRGVKSASKALSALKKSTAGVAVAIGSITTAAAGLFKAAQTFDKMNMSVKQTQALIKATGGAAGLTASEIEKFSRELALGTLASEQGVMRAANKLLTFKSIAGDTFKETLKLSQDLASIGFGDVESSAVQLAKALEAPEIGLTMLRRVGVSFSKTQIDMIKGMVKFGDTAKAQEMILKSIRDQIGGAGEAQAEGTLAGAVDTLGQRFRELQETLAKSGAYNMAIKGINLITKAVVALNDALNLTTEEALASAEKRLADFVEKRGHLIESNETIAKNYEHYKQRVAELRAELQRKNQTEQREIELLEEKQKKQKKEKKEDELRLTRIRREKEAREKFNAQQLESMELLKKMQDEIAKTKFDKIVEDMKDNAEKTKTIYVTLSDATKDLADDMVEVFTNADKTIGDLLKSIASNIASSLIADFITTPIVQGIKTRLPKPSGKAAGGSVAAGMPITVGEQGREVFVPRTPGTIVPNTKVGSSGNTINFNITSLDPKQAAQVILENRNTIIGVVQDSFTRAGNNPQMA